VQILGQRGAAEGSVARADEEGGEGRRGRAQGAGRVDQQPWGSLGCVCVGVWIESVSQSVNRSRRSLARPPTSGTYARLQASWLAEEGGGACLRTHCRRPNRTCLLVCRSEAPGLVLAGWGSMVQPGWLAGWWPVCEWTVSPHLGL